MIPNIDLVEGVGSVGLKAYRVQGVLEGAIEEM